MKKREYLEIVDENNRSLQIRKEKLQAHLDKDWHRTTQIWVLNKEGRILVNRRSENQFQDPGKWASFFGGHLLFGEDYLKGALREIKEELGLKVTGKRLKKVELRKNPGPNEFVQVFTLFLKPSEKISYSRKEFQKIIFISVRELHKWAKEKPSDFSGGLNYIKDQIKQL